MFNEVTFKGKWNQIKGEAQRVWGKLTNDDLDGVKGNVNLLVGVVQEKYSLKKEQIMDKIDDMIAKLTDSNSAVDEKGSDSTNDDDVVQRPIKNPGPGTGPSAARQTSSGQQDSASPRKLVTMLLVSGALHSGILLLPSHLVANVNASTHEAATKLGASAVDEISFSTGSYTLSDKAKRDLSEFIADARKKGEITNVKVVAWADREYPAKGAEASNSEKDLAQNRAEAVSDYLESTLLVTSVQTVNMAKRPNAVERAIKTPGARTKTTLEESGAAPTSEANTGLFGLKGKASHVVIMVYYKK